MSIRLETRLAVVRAVVLGSMALGMAVIMLFWDAQRLRAEVRLRASQPGFLYSAPRVLERK